MGLFFLVFEMDIGWTIMEQTMDGQRTVVGNHWQQYNSCSYLGIARLKLAMHNVVWQTWSALYAKLLQ